MLVVSFALSTYFVAMLQLLRKIFLSPKKYLNIAMCFNVLFFSSLILRATMQFSNGSSVPSGLLIREQGHAWKSLIISKTKGFSYILAVAKSFTKA